MKSGKETISTIITKINQILGFIVQDNKTKESKIILMILLSILNLYLRQRIITIKNIKSKIKIRRNGKNDQKK